MSQSLAAFQSASEVMLRNGRQDPEVQAVLAPFGYTPERLDEGLALLEAVTVAGIAQTDAHARKATAFNALEAAREALHRQFARDVKLARLVFPRATPAYGTLGLSGNRARGRAARLAQADAFYQTLHDAAELSSALTTFTVDAAAGQALVQTTKEAASAYAQAQGAAKAATARRDAAVAEAKAFMRVYRQVAKIACEPIPQLSERLGITDRR